MSVVFMWNFSRVQGEPTGSQKGSKLCSRFQQATRCWDFSRVAGKSTGISGCFQPEAAQSELMLYDKTHGDLLDFSDFQEASVEFEANSRGSQQGFLRGFKTFEGFTVNFSGLQSTKSSSEFSTGYQGVLKGLSGFKGFQRFQEEIWKVLGGFKA